jgi:hypothetical protein
MDGLIQVTAGHQRAFQIVDISTTMNSAMISAVPTGVYGPASGAGWDSYTTGFSTSFRLIMKRPRGSA